MDHVDPLALQLPRAPEAPGIARRQLARSFGDVLGADQLQTVRLLTSELVTNALVHGAGTITVLASLADHRLHVEVIDEGNGLDSTAPARRGVDGVGGYGLQIVDSEASRWGIGCGTTHVWFELEC